MATPDFIKAPIALVNNFVLPHPRAQQVDMSGKTVLVTGVTPGSIGFVTACTLSLWGARVIATARSETSIQAAHDAFKQTGLEVEVLPMDLASKDSVASFVNRLQTDISQLDVLINNAGIYLDVLGKWKTEKLSSDGFEVHWRTNYLGSVQLSLALLELLEEANGARVINVSSHMHDNCTNEEMFTGLQPYKSVKAYGRSKLAINHFTFAAHERFAARNIDFFCLHPGSVFTNIVDKGLEESPMLLSLRSKFSIIEKLILLSPDEGAQTQILCASAPELSGGKYYRRCKEEQAATSLGDSLAREQLWELTQQQLQKIA